MFLDRSFVEWIIGSREAQLCDAAGNLAMEKIFGPIAVFDGVCLAFFQCFMYQVIYVGIELLFLLGFNFGHRAVLILTVLSGPRANFSLHCGIKKEMDDPFVKGFDLSRFSSLIDRILNRSLARVFLFADFHELIGADPVFEICRLSFIHEIVGD